jgi:hypothetical protein
MLDMMIKMNMIKKGVVLPSMQMVRHNTPTTSLSRKRDSRIKLALEDFSFPLRPRSPSQGALHEYSAYAMYPDIRGYFHRPNSHTPQRQPSKESFKKHHTPDDLKQQINIVINE